MSYTKAKLYNLALSLLLLAKEVEEIETDTSNEVRVLNIHWDTAFESTLQDLDLDSLSVHIPLELLAEDEYGPFKYIYKYPNNCIFLRRLKSGFETDNKTTHLAKKTGIYNGQKVIYTNEYQAVGECIPKNVPLVSLSPMAALAVAYKLALLSAPLIVGKGAKALKDDLKADYVICKTEAQETDVAENMNYENDDIRSEFVQARLE